MHFSEYKHISEAVVAFAQLARSRNLQVGIQETQDALRMVECGVYRDYERFGFALRGIFCSSKEETEVFDKLYEHFWKDRSDSIKSKISKKIATNVPRNSPASLVWMGMNKDKAEEEEEAKNVSGANATERLRKTDFSKIEEVETELLEELAIKLWKEMSLRIKRKMKNSNTEGKIDLRKTIRANMDNGGEMIKLRRKKKVRRKQRLVILLDVSGSMDKYSFFLLRFVLALQAHFEKIEAFIFSTSLICITDYIDHAELNTALAVLSSRAHNWSSGTQIGRCFEAFNEHHAKRVLNGQSTVIVVSDGLDTGDPTLLASELNKIKLRTRKLIWLNPLKGMRGYEPTARGMSAALPEIDVFNSAHNLDSLLELEKYLTYV